MANDSKNGLNTTFNFLVYISVYFKTNLKFFYYCCKIKEITCWRFYTETNFLKY